MSLFHKDFLYSRGRRYFKPFFSFNNSIDSVVKYTLICFPSIGPRQDEEVKNSQQEFRSKESRGSIIPSQLLCLGKTFFTGIKAQNPAVG